MKVIVCDSYEEMSLKAAEMIKEQINSKPDSILGLATGSTPIGTYQCLVDMYKKGEVDFSRVTTFNLDEYYPIKKEAPQSYHYFMNENLFSYVNIDPSRIHIPNGETDDPHAECAQYEKSVHESGGVDIQILGIGRNGHIGFNEPDMSLDAKTHLTALTEDTINANSRFFENEEEVPKHALTMGMSTILSSKKIILLANGRSKHNAISELLTTSITTGNPSTFLKVHPDVTIICDYEAYTDMRIGVDIGGMSVKIGVVDKDKIVERRDFPIKPEMSADDITNQIADICLDFEEKYQIARVGVGTPGTIKDGCIKAANLPFKNYPFVEALSKKIKIPVLLENDGNCAALGEYMAGMGRQYSNMVLITLGTGIGAGIIIDGKIYSGSGAAGEVGHICIELDGKKCPCGDSGCFEQYASVTALINQTKQAAEENPDSILAQIVNSSEVSGKTIFEALDKNCPAAQKAFDRYLDYLAAGIRSVINLLAPEHVVISGGLSNANEKLFKPLAEKLGHHSEIISISELKNDAGIIGAALL